MKPIYNENGEIIDYSDGGSQFKKIEDEVDLYYRLKRLPKRVQKIAKFIREGYTYKEIGKKMGLTETNIKQIVFRNRLKCNPS